jgi:integrase
MHLTQVVHFGYQQVFEKATTYAARIFLDKAGCDKLDFGNKTPQEISPFDVDKLRVNLLKSKKPATVKNVLELLRRIVTFGEKKQLCPGLGFTIQMPKVNNEKTEDLSPDELRKLLEVLDNEPNTQVANLMKMALLTGMRRGELYRLKWSDIDFERGLSQSAIPKAARFRKYHLTNKRD